MNIITARQLGSAFVLIGALAGCTASKAPDAAPAATTPAPEATASAQPSSTPVPEAKEAPMPIPDTTDGIWRAIDEHSAELKALMQGGSLETVHQHAFAIRDLVAALPERSKSLPADEQAKLQSDVKFVATLADRLDATGDANDRAGTQANYDKLVAVLNGIPRTK